jgi:hypothetical protein
VTFLVHLVSLQFKDEVDFNVKFDRKVIEEVIEICMNFIIGMIRIFSSFFLTEFQFYLFI